MRENRAKQNRAGKRLNQQVAKKEENNAPPAKRPAQQVQQQLVCGYCKKVGHTQKDCRRANGQCLICGSAEHQARDCPRHRNGNATLQLPAPPIRGNQGPVGRGAPLPPQNVAYNRAQSGNGTGRGRGKAYSMKGKEVAISEGFGSGNGSVHQSRVSSS